jgi:predicted nucleic acid-binding protein
MKVVVKDATVLIDLAKCELLGAWFSLAIPTLTTSFVWSEIRHAEQRRIIEPWVKNQTLKIVDFGAEELSTLVRFRSELTSALSLEDASVLHLTIREDGLLLTSDGALRRCAENRQVPVAGILWIFDRLIESAVLERLHAANHLELLIATGSRLPKSDCAIRIRRWRKEC